jgi:hypothetical protein
MSRPLRPLADAAGRLGGLTHRFGDVDRDKLAAAGKNPTIDNHRIDVRGLA